MTLKKYIGHTFIYSKSLDYHKQRLSKKRGKKKHRGVRDGRERERENRTVPLNERERNSTTDAQVIYLFDFLLPLLEERRI